MAEIFLVGGGVIITIAVIVGLFMAGRALYFEDKSYCESSRRYHQNMRECWEELRKWRESLEEARRKQKEKQ